MNTRHLRLATALGAAALALAACGGGGSDSSSSSGNAPASAAVTPAGASGTVIKVDETDFHIGMPSMQLTAGTYTFAVNNAGQFPHALEIEGPGLEESKTTNLSPGQSESLTVTLQKGDYELYCPVDSHKDKGMDLHITVS